MTILTWLFVYVLFLHWVGDFVLQTQYMAENKSKNFEALVLHVFVYTCVLFIGTSVTTQYGINDLCRFAVINFFIHLSVDATTSRYTKMALEAKNMHRFFAILGFDQFVHAATLLLTTFYLLGKP